MGLWPVLFSPLRALTCSGLIRLAQKDRPEPPVTGQHNDNILALKLFSKPSQGLYKESFLYITKEFLL